MTALEVREFRSISKKLVEIEEKGKMMEELRRRKVCLPEEEAFVQNLHSKFKVLNTKKGVRGKNHDDLVKLALKIKIRDNNLYGVKVRKKRNYLRKVVEDSLGSKSCQYRNLMDNVKKNARNLRGMLKKKYKKKIEHLDNKFGQKRQHDADKNLLSSMGNPSIFVSDLEPEEIKNPVIVEGRDENIVLSVDEMDVLKLGPKFCVYANLDEEIFETDLEEAIMKIKWDMLGDSDDKKKTGLEDVALRVLLGDEVCDNIEEENDEEHEIQEAEAKIPFQHKEMTFNFAKRKATDMKGNSRVFFPRKARSLEEESSLETLRVELRALFKNYISKNCSKGGKQITNLTKNQVRGLKSLKKRVSEGELVIIPTDKSGNLAVLTRQSYLEAGLKHTKNDREVNWEAVKTSQKEINGHTSMLIKTFKIGHYWEHGGRIRETTMGEGASICPLSLLFKDHKGWSAESGTAPPTRPVVGGHLGINMHLSEIISDILDPVVATYEGGKEIISTEDMVARVVRLNASNEGWTRDNFWKNMKTRVYKSCDECTGEDDYTWDDDNPETCGCEDGVDEDGRTIITMGGMRKLRRSLWEQ